MSRAQLNRQYVALYEAILDNPYLVSQVEKVTASVELVPCCTHLCIHINHLDNLFLKEYVKKVEDDLSFDELQILRQVAYDRLAAKRAVRRV